MSISRTLLTALVILNLVIAIHKNQTFSQNQSQNPYSNLTVSQYPVIQQLPASYLTSTSQSSANYDPLSQCVTVNSALAVQVSSLVQYSRIVDVPNTSPACQNTLGLALNVDQLLGTDNNSTNNSSNNQQNQGLLGGLLGGLVGGLLKTVDNLLKSVLGLVNNLVGNVLMVNCGATQEVVNEIGYDTKTVAKSMAHVKMCLDPTTRNLVNVNSGAYVTLDNAQALQMAGFMNALATASGSASIQSPIGDVTLDTNLTVQTSSQNN